MARWLLVSFLLLAGSASAFETHDLDWVDEKRERSVPVRLYWPESDRPVALVVFSHGIGGSRIKAAVLLSAPPFYGEDDPKKILGSLTLPTLHVTATEDTIRIPGFYSPVGDRLAVFDAVGSPLKALAVFEGGSHSIFTNRGGTGGAELNPQVKAATRELALAFLRRVFDGAGDALERWPQTYAPLLARWVSPGAAAAR